MSDYNYYRGKVVSVTPANKLRVKICGPEGYSVDRPFLHAADNIHDIDTAKFNKQNPAVGDTADLLLKWDDVVKIKLPPIPADPKYPTTAGAWKPYGGGVAAAELAFYADMNQWYSKDVHKATPLPAAIDALKTASSGGGLDLYKYARALLRGNQVETDLAAWHLLVHDCFANPTVKPLSKVKLALPVMLNAGSKGHNRVKELVGNNESVWTMKFAYGLLKGIALSKI